MARSSRQYLLLRIGAFLIDGLLIALLLILPASLLSWSVIRSGGAMNWIARIWNVTFSLFMIGILLRDGWKGRSIGKLIMGLELRHVSGQPPGYLASMLRNLVLLVPVLNLIEIGFLFFSRGARRLGDRIAGTVVVEE
ncbi:MAG: RDD family protein [Thermoanaerobaculia bacterium]|nr:RDD family protein [Thermoanaerobaculia bacterium]